MGIAGQIKRYLFHDYRRKKIVDFVGQLQIAVEIILHVLVFYALLITILFVPPFATWLSDHALSTHQNIFAELLEINADKWPFLILALLILSLFSVLFSHRIAGPIYKLGNVLRKYSDRDLKQRATLREHDLLHKLVDPTNAFRQTVNGDLMEIRSALGKIQEASNALPEGAARDQIRKPLAEALDKANQYSLEEIESSPSSNHSS